LRPLRGAGFTLWRLPRVPVSFADANESFTLGYFRASLRDASRRGRIRHVVDLPGLRIETGAPGVFGMLLTSPVSESRPGAPGGGRIRYVVDLPGFRIETGGSRRLLLRRGSNRAHYCKQVGYPESPHGSFYTGFMLHSADYSSRSEHRRGRPSVNETGVLNLRELAPLCGVAGWQVRSVFLRAGVFHKKIITKSTNLCIM
jgi:hypothetical protein